MKERVAIIGASDKPERYSYKAMQLLIENGHEVMLIHPRLKEVDGHKVYSKLSEIEGDVDTITLYINPTLQEQIHEEILQFPTSRVIFNPGTENAGLAAELKERGVSCEEACTLVLLRTGQF